MQYCILIIINLIALLLSRKYSGTNWFAAIIPWLVTCMQLSELPFSPVLPIWYSGLICIWIFCSIYFLTIEVVQSLYQAIPVFLLLFIGLPTRIVLLHQGSFDLGSYIYLALFVTLSIVACINLTIAWVGGRQSDNNSKLRAKKKSA